MMSNQSDGTPSSSTPNATDSQIGLNTISNDSIPQEYLNVAKQMMLSKTMYTIWSHEQQAYAHLDCQWIKMEQEIVNLKTKGTADEKKVLQLECDKAALEQRVRELEIANKTATAENEKLATNLELCERKLRNATSSIQNLEENLKEKNTEIAKLKAVTLNTEKVENNKSVTKIQDENDGQSSKRGKYDVISE